MIRRLIILLLLSLLTPSWGQSIEIPHKMMNQNTTLNIPIFIYNVTNLESIHLKIEYDESIILAEEIIENPVGILDGGYTFTTNLTELGIIEIAIGSNSTNIFSGSGMIAQIVFQSIGSLGEVSALTFSDAQINSDWQILTVDGSIEIILDELVIIAEGFGSDDSITLGMCEGCTDVWRYGEDEYDIDPFSDAYTDIYFFNMDWYGQTDVNDNTCDQVKFASDYRQQHSTSQLVSWGISGTTEDISSDTPIIFSWDVSKLITDSNNFKMYIYVGETEYDMQEMDNITISQSDLTLNGNGEPNIWVKMGGCADTGKTITYYQDSDGDGLGASVEGEFCEGLQPEGWVDTNDGDICNGEEDCLGTCGGYAITDECGICDLDINNNNQCYDCNGVPNGEALLDNCSSCVEGDTGEVACQLDCLGAWGGSALEDDCGICEGNQIDGDLDDDGDICETTCTEELDCFGICGGSATTDDCDICVGGTTGLDPCIPDCLGIPGGNAYSDECGVCDSNTNNDNEQCLDCNSVPNGDSVLDNCGTCDNNVSNDCIMDCNGEWSGEATIDEYCGTCIGGSTGLEACSLDCNGVWGGYAFTDECGVCDSVNTNNNQCFDCNSEPNGGAIIDNCNECILEGEISSCVQGCDGIWNNNGFEVEYDECGVCGGNNSSCTDCFGDVNGEAWINACEGCVPLGDTSCSVDCAGVPNGDSVLDNCGTCDNNVSNDCIMDCNGEWSGEATIDEHCGTCIGGSTGLEACSLDCNGVWGGNSENDLCGICDADAENNNQCLDCNGMVDGVAILDNCGNCVEDLSDSNYECEQDCNGIYGGNHPPTFTCQNGNIACNYDECFDSYGCTDSVACNYDETATADDGSCLEYDACEICGGDNSCLNNDCGGFGFEDSCGVCSGDYFGHEADSDIDCNGDCFGDATLDSCDVCSGGNSGHTANSDFDVCGVCDGNGIPNGECDCNGNVLDDCGVCGGDGIPEGVCDCEGNLNNCTLCPITINSDGYGDCNQELGYALTGNICEMIIGCGVGNDEEWFFDTYDECTSGCQNCKVLDPEGYGLCEMVLGWGWTGTACEQISGCGAGDDAPWFYEDEEICNGRCSYGYLSNETVELPQVYTLAYYPNPFNPTTTISFSIPEFGLTIITAYDINGRKLETLTNEVLSIGDYSINWDASSFPSGVYLIRMDSGDFTQTQKVVLIK